ncbi:Uncharacterised protein [Roseomonas gilardii subsp. rosea]|nr:Uncharacterised protein [Roseomonas gilardii subsp. rosea]
MAAASILLQGGSGMRISEVEMLEANKLDPKTGLPDCLEIRTDDTGNIELFYAKGYLVKTTQSRAPAEWLIGVRVVGSDILPPPVKGICRVFEMALLLDPERKNPNLFLGSAQGSWEYFSGGVVVLDRTQHQGLQRAFAANYVGKHLLEQKDLIRTHAWRKSFAQFMFAFDPTLGPALSQHFKHLKIAMTMEAYVTNDPALLGYLDSERSMETARDLYELSTGRQAGAGSLAKEIGQHVHQLQQIIQGRSKRDAIEALHAFVDDHHIPFWFLEWGQCGINLAPNEAACHQEAGTTSWNNQAPNFEYRDLDVCAGCRRLLILRRHQHFWQDRRDRLMTAVQGLDESIGAVVRRALRKKLSQAEAILKAISKGGQPLEKSP